jgi:hypothetical protein
MSKTIQLRENDMIKTKERPIIFNGEMVRAVLSGIKTQTRRVIKPQPDFVANYYEPNKPRAAWKGGSIDPEIIKCLYGHAGDLLWVRETWATEKAYDHLKPSELSPEWASVYFNVQTYSPEADIGKKRPSIFMPRWASRITLRITNVGVERVQDISNMDACQEGVEATGIYTSENARASFRVLWDSIYAQREYGWDVNPWVWVVKFEIVEVA